MPDALAALGYDAARMLMDAMERSQPMNGKTIASTLARTKGFAGVTGSISMDAERNAVKQAVIVQMKGGQPVYQIDINPAEAAMLDAPNAPAVQAPPAAPPNAPALPPAVKGPAPVPAPAAR